MKEMYGLPLSKAEGLIFRFFGDNAELIETFVETAADMIDNTVGTLVKYNGAIIGVANVRGHCRFYVSKNNGAYTIKYKHQPNHQPFLPGNKAEYFSLNAECNKYFDEHPELCGSDKGEYLCETEGAERKTQKALREAAKRQWNELLRFSEAAMSAEKVEVETAVLRSYYEDIITLLSTFTQTVFSEQISDTIIQRVLLNNGVTLQSLGDKHGITRERIRQIENKKWSNIVKGFYSSTREVFVPWREELSKLLLNIPASHYVQAMAYFLNENERVGEFLIWISTPTYKPEEYRMAISQYSFKRKLSVKSNERIPNDVVASVRNIPILPFIQSIQQLREYGESYKGVCPACASESMLVFPKKNAFQCYSCKKGGNIINYVMESDGIDYRAAILKLSEIYHIGEEYSYLPRPVVMREAALFYHEELKKNPENKNAIDVIHYWGVCGKTVVRLGLGFNDNVNDTALKYLKFKKGISEETLIRDNIIAEAEKGARYDRMRNSIIIPTINIDGEVVCLDYYSIDKGRFFFYPPGMGFYRLKNLYSLNLAIKSQKKSVIIVSDYQSYFALAGKDVMNVVSTYMPQITEAQIQLIKERFKAVIVVADAVCDLKICCDFCKNNGIICECLEVGESSQKYISENIDNILQRVEYYEVLFNE